MSRRAWGQGITMHAAAWCMQAPEKERARGGGEQASNGHAAAWCMQAPERRGHVEEVSWHIHNRGMAHGGDEQASNMHGASWCMQAPEKERAHGGGEADT